MDRLSRLADSLVQGMTPGRPAAALVAEADFKGLDQGSSAGLSAAPQELRAQSGDLGSCQGQSHELMAQHERQTSQPERQTSQHKRQTSQPERQTSQHDRQVSPPTTSQTETVSVQSPEAPSQMSADTDSLHRHCLPLQQHTTCIKCELPSEESFGEPSTLTPSMQSVPTDPTRAVSSAAPSAPVRGGSEGNHPMPASGMTHVAGTVCASEAAAARNAADHGLDQHQCREGANQAGEPDRLGHKPGGSGCGAASQHEQQDGLMSDSENEFEQSLVAARGLRPASTTARCAALPLCAWPCE